MPPRVLEYQPSFGKGRAGLIVPLLVAGGASAVLGMLWAMIAMGIFGLHFGETMAVPCVIAGACAGIAGGLFTVWTRHRTAGRESFRWTLATYYIGISSFGSVLLATAVVGSLTNGNFFPISATISEDARLILMLIIFGTFPYIIVLLPLCCLSRMVVWEIYCWLRHL